MQWGIDNYSLRRLLKQLLVAPHGSRLSELLVSVATGGSWPRVRRHEQLKGKREVLCPRCFAEPETPFHRIWGCAENGGCKTYTDSESLTSAAHAGADSAACFWLRGLIPAAWTAVPPPPSSEDWHIRGSSSSDLEGCLGEGSDHDPIIVFGDASGGSNAADQRFIRVGPGLLHSARLSPAAFGRR
eukprot:9321349-Pyramimonas_sp.AAC.1